jgi:RNA polymerase sigma-70 factor (ECF subfamily)
MSRCSRKKGWRAGEVAEERVLEKGIALVGGKIWMTPSSPLSEKDLLSLVRRGDREAYGRVVEKYMKPAYFIALGLVRDPQDAMDLSQEAFIRAFRGIKRFDTERPFFPWLYRILKNLCIDHLKKCRRHNEIPLEGIQVAGKKEQDKELTEILWNGIQKLPFEQKEIIILRYFQQLTYREIADITSKPLGTIMSSLCGAKKKLRGILGKYMGFEERQRGDVDGTS